MFLLRDWWEVVSELGMYKKISCCPEFTWLKCSDTGRAFENLVYWHLRYLGFSVHIGTLYGKEVDFFVKKLGSAFMCR